MKNNNSSIAKAAAFLGLFIGLFGTSFAASPTILFNETFRAPLAKDHWTIKPKNADVSSSEGVLTIHANTTDTLETAYAVTRVYAATPQPWLNFAKNTIHITLTDLDIAGNAEPGFRVFFLILGSDQPGDDATSNLSLRIDADGHVTWSASDKNSTTPLFTYKCTVTLPIKSLKITVDAKSSTISIQDRHGLTEKKLPFSAPPEAWLSSAPYIRLQAQRNPGPGDTVVTLEGFSVDSTLVSVR